MELLNSLITVVDVYSICTYAWNCTGVRSKGIPDGTFVAGLGANTPAGTVPPPPLMEAVPVVVEAAMDLVDLAILMLVPLGVGVLCFINNINFKIYSV